MCGVTTVALTPPRGFSTWNAFPVHSIEEGTAYSYVACAVCCQSRGIAEHVLHVIAPTQPTCTARTPLLTVDTKQGYTVAQHCSNAGPGLSSVHRYRGWAFGWPRRWCTATCWQCLLVRGGVVVRGVLAKVLCAFTACRWLGATRGGCWTAASPRTTQCAHQPVHLTLISKCC